MRATQRRNNRFLPRAASLTPGLGSSMWIKIVVETDLRWDSISGGGRLPVDGGRQKLSDDNDAKVDKRTSSLTSSRRFIRTKVGQFRFEDAEFY